MSTSRSDRRHCLLTRRSFVLAGSSMAGAALASAEACCQTPVDETPDDDGSPGDKVKSVPIIDTHIHLFDATRPQGAPYAGPGGDSPRVALPPRYRGLAVPLGIVGAIKVEASPWIEDNLWALQIAQQDPMIVGVIGNLEPDKPEFPQYLDRFRKNDLFRGIRYGNLWGYDLSQQVDNRAFIDGLKRLAAADLVLDSANPNPDLLRAILRLSDHIPDLQIIIDHLPALEPAASERADYDRLLKELKPRGNIFMKLSSVIHRVDGVVSGELSAYRDRIESLLEVFGEDRVLFGSDWPNSDRVASLESIVGLAREYFSTQPRRITEKVFWRNSLNFYRWTHRAESQPRQS